MNKVILAHNALMMLTSGDDEESRRLSYASLSQFSEDDEVVVYPAENADKDIIQAVQNLVKVLMEKRQPHLLVNISIPSVNSVIETATAMITLKGVPAITEEIYEYMKSSFREVLDKVKIDFVEFIDNLEPEPILEEFKDGIMGERVLNEDWVREFAKKHAELLHMWCSSTQTLDGVMNVIELNTRDLFFKVLTEVTNVKPDVDEPESV